MLIAILYTEDAFSNDGWLCLFFFFQAEDGIRDLTVTGVQTCALPISLSQERVGRADSIHFGKPFQRFFGCGRISTPNSLLTQSGGDAEQLISIGSEIGRASCRERV